MPSPMAAEPAGQPPIREDIVVAAARIFREEGYEGATLEEIAAAVGIKKASLYHHIRSKEDLLYTIHERLITNLIRDTAADLARTDGSPRAQLRSFMRTAMRFVAEHHDEVSVFLSERRVLSRSRWLGIVAERDRYQAMLESILVEGVRTNEFRAVAPQLVALGALGMTNWGYVWFRESGRCDAEQIADLFSDMLLDGLSVRQPPRGASRS